MLDTFLEKNDKVNYIWLYLECTMKKPSILLQCGVQIAKGGSHYSLSNIAWGSFSNATKWVFLHIYCPYRAGIRFADIQGENMRMLVMSVARLLRLFLFFKWSGFVTLPPQGQTTTKDKDVPKLNTDLSEDLFKVHDFDVKIDLQVPNAGECTSRNLAHRRGPLFFALFACLVPLPLQRPSLCQ